ncbi:MAG: sugar ABC transporter permease [Eubacteriales bacterium]|nr:sugar ABC transporter permease [Eubacteriales bacterium]
MKNGLRLWKQALPFVGPALALLCLFVLYPLGRNIVISFTNYDILQDHITELVGFKHYTDMFNNGKYLIALRNTLLYTLITVPGQMLLGLILACLLKTATRGQTIFKVICYLPVLTSWVIVSLVFRYLFTSGKGGLINYALLQIGVLTKPVAWLQGEWTANMVLWVFGIWKGVGWVMIIYLAALQGVSKDIYEAAQIDSANTIQTFVHITVPLVKNTSLYLLTVLTIGGFGAYIHVMMITEGAPLGTTNQLMNLMYTTAFSKYDFGYAAAQAVVMGLMIFSLTLIQRRLSSETVNWWRTCENENPTKVPSTHPALLSTAGLCMFGTGSFFVHGCNCDDAASVQLAVSANPAPAAFLPE